MLGHVAEPGVYSAAAAAGGPDEEKLDNADTVCFQLQYHWSGLTSLTWFCTLTQWLL